MLELVYLGFHFFLVARIIGPSMCGPAVSQNLGIAKGLDRHANWRGWFHELDECFYSGREKKESNSSN